MRHRSFALLSLIGILSITAFAVTPQFWENFTQEDLLQGKLTRVSLSSEGKLFLASSYDAVYDTNQPYVFSMVRDKAGNVYLGTGNEGRVYKIDPQGKGSLYYQSKELDVFALALDASDTLYVGTSPDGKVYKVTGANQATEFCDPEDKYIWSMVFDESGNLYIGTGARGIIYKVDKSGKKTTFLDSDETHIVCLARESNGRLLAGTAPNSLVIEITPEGKAFTLLDAPMEEIRALAVDRFGTIYAVASSSKGLPQRLSGGPEIVAEPGTGALSVMTIQSLAALAEKSGASKATVSAPGSEKDTAGSRSSIYAISKDGNTEAVYTSKDQMVFDIAVRDGDGSLLAATGPKGRLLSIDAAKQVTVVTDSPEEEMTRLVPAGDAVWVAGSNQGKVYKLDSQRAQTGTFESKVLDAKTIASWGKIAWRTSSAGAQVEISTRSGNTQKPDNSWSDWTPPYTTPAGQQITSPRARYFQWRATFKRASGSAPSQSSDMLERVQIPYLQQNVRPQVVSINVLPYGVALQKQPAMPPGTVPLSTTSAADGLSLNSPRERNREKQPIPPRQVFQPGSQSFTWKATDDNDDSLEYSLFFKGEGESDWKLLEKKLTDTFYTLDAASLPDGVYTLKVVASDEPSNPFGKFQIGELISRPFVISNSTPQIEIVSHRVNGKRVEIQFRAKVAAGRIGTAEFSIDGGDWLLVFPVDGIADSAQEEFQFTTPELSVGEHLIGLRSSDANGNTGTSKLVVKIQ